MRPYRLPWPSYRAPDSKAMSDKTCFVRVLGHRLVHAMTRHICCSALPYVYLCRDLSSSRAVSSSALRSLRKGRIWQVRSSDWMARKLLRLRPKHASNLLLQRSQRIWPVSSGLALLEVDVHADVLCANGNSPAPAKADADTTASACRGQRERFMGTMTSCRCVKPEHCVPFVQSVTSWQAIAPAPMPRNPMLPPPKPHPTPKPQPAPSPANSPSPKTAGLLRR